MKKIILLLTLTLLTSCHYKISNYPSLVNQGILPISKQQAYVGANLFLSNEMQASPYLYNFLKKQGAPDAIEIVSKSFNNDRFYLYYYNAKEVYIADPRISHGKRNWIIKGPKIPNWRDLKSLRNVIDLSKDEAPFVIDGKEEYFKTKSPSNLPTVTMQEVKNIDQKVVDLAKLPKSAPKRNVPRKRYTPKKTQVVKQVAPKEATQNIEQKQALENQGTIEAPKDDFITSLEDLKTYHPINSDKMAIAVSKGYANRDEQGNVIHTVKSYTETLQAISYWYTGNEINAVEIEKFNNLTDASNLRIGQKIIIPFSMLKNVKQMRN